MTTTVAPNKRNVTVVGGTFGYGTYGVTFSPPINGISAAEYPAHFVLDAAGLPVDPMTEETGQALVAAIQDLTTQLLGQAVVLQNAFGGGASPIGGGSAAIGGLFPAPADLPTTLPSTPGVYWNDGGFLAIS